MTEESVVENTGNAQERKALRPSFGKSYMDKFGYSKNFQALLMVSTEALISSHCEHFSIVTLRQSSAFGKSFIAAAIFSHTENSDIFM
ncbi:hypothetical protein CH63R_10134 [Colletotrichum higginsianum IMI 349063]|uniref:Uncharacterized protein n=1 Tax=Colletotrichum higginsianum (strain IMI 349063) TaxID=759273 RepID=A0A1B7Y1Y2_COLHI|nr:uncharacterized protein CH63R_10134 [Colletotrichum higginsianum IMI 349063]OBR06014.1 hypothetical protein CH63R_10134 [Colletotrichum higginsianum IMI 349063]